MPLLSRSSQAGGRQVAWLLALEWSLGPAQGDCLRQGARAEASEANRPPREGRRTQSPGLGLPRGRREHRARPRLPERKSGSPTWSSPISQTAGHAQVLKSPVGTDPFCNCRTSHYAQEQSQNARDLWTFHRKKHRTNEHGRNVKIVSAIHSPNGCRLGDHSGWGLLDHLQGKTEYSVL